MTKHYRLNNLNEIEECSMENAWNQREINNRIIGKTIIRDSKVSTVFLTINHNHFEGPPILFETMIFGGEYDGYQERYCTYQEAVEGHLKTIDMVRENK